MTGGNPFLVVEAHHAELGGLAGEACRCAIAAAVEAEWIGAVREMKLQASRALVTLAWPRWSLERVGEAKAAVEQAIAVLGPPATSRRLPGLTRPDRSGHARSDDGRARDLPARLAVV